MSRVIGPNMHHPGAHERRQNGEAASRAQLAVDRGLKSGKLELIDMDEDELLNLASRALDCVRILRGLR